MFQFKYVGTTSDVTLQVHYVFVGPNVFLSWKID